MAGVGRRYGSFIGILARVEIGTSVLASTRVYSSILDTRNPSVFEYTFYPSAPGYSSILAKICGPGILEYNKYSDTQILKKKERKT